MDFFTYFYFFTVMFDTIILRSTEYKNLILIGLLQWIMQFAIVMPKIKNASVKIELTEASVNLFFKNLLFEFFSKFASRCERSKISFFEKFCRAVIQQSLPPELKREPVKRSNGA